MTNPHDSEQSSSDMSDLELPDIFTPQGLIVPDSKKSLILPGTEFNPDVHPERQGIVEDIQKRYKGDNDRISKELVEKIKTWENDEYGISYLAISGVDFTENPIEFHGNAQYFAFSANDASGSNFENADLSASIFTASYMYGSSFRNANLNNAIMTCAQLQNTDLRNISAIDAILNFADITGALVKGMRLNNAYLVGTKGFDARIVQDVADFTAARTLGRPDFSEVNDGIGNALSTRFITGSSEDEKVAIAMKTRALRQAKHYQGQQFVNKFAPELRIPGAVLEDMNLHGVRLTSAELEAVVFNNVHAQGISLRSARMAGATAINTTFNDGDFEAVNGPGQFSVNSRYRNVHFDESKVAGVHINDDLTGATFDERMPVDGLLIVGGRPPLIEDPGLRDKIKVLSPSEMPPRTMRSIATFARQQAELVASSEERRAVANQTTDNQLESGQ